ncbi:HU family DNA-binding protein [Natronosporangium hydrolyticum]|uniref:HU family DNA-binding protein n=1 Tax=Natronosporangium hydrolyticum TaxID=2811111 RepID=UPI0023BAE9EF|nr:HU family DNA-binding protein [Natronosporangium hydrolyticum]
MPARADRRDPGKAPRSHDQFSGGNRMNKRTLVETVAAKAGLTKTVAESALDAMVGAISDALADGEKVAIPGFGTFEVRDRPARIGRNPQTGETMEIAARRVPGFKPAAALKDEVSR